MLEKENLPQEEKEKAVLEEAPLEDTTNIEEKVPVQENDNVSSKEETLAYSETSEEESDFADEIKTSVPENIPTEEKKEPEEPAVDMRKEETQETKEEEAPVSGTFDYSDPDLEAIEEARASFNKVNRKYNIIKWLLTGVALAILACSWIIPNTIPAIQAWNESAPMIIMICGIVIALIAMVITSTIFRKKVEKAMEEYFNAYYTHSNSYVYGSRVQNFEGSVKTKIRKEDIVESNIYNDCNYVGSRSTYTFDYAGVHITVADAAAQALEKRSQKTLFVGKYFFYENTYKGNDILIYFKGNNRALPPNNLAGRKVIEDTRTMVIYGDNTSHKVLTKRVKNALASFDTNKTFVDMSISIREGKTYIAVGFEDDLMVLPLKQPFDPRPTNELKKVTGQVLDLVDALLHPHERP